MLKKFIPFGVIYISDKNPLPQKTLLRTQLN